MKFKKEPKPGDSYSFSRSSKHSLKFSNPTKLSCIKLLTSEYRRQCSKIIEHIFINGFDGLDYGIKSKTPKLFNLPKESYSLPSFLPTEFLHLFSEHSFLSLALFQNIGKHVISLITSSAKKYASDKFPLNREITHLEKKNSKSKKLDKLRIRYHNLKVLKPSCKSIPLLLNENHLDLLVNTQELFNILDTDKSTGELLYSDNPKNKTIFLNSDNQKKEFDLFLQLSSLITKENPFKERWGNY